MRTRLSFPLVCPFSFRSHHNLATSSFRHVASLFYAILLLAIVSKVRHHCFYVLLIPRSTTLAPSRPSSLRQRVRVRSSLGVDGEIRCFHFTYSPALPWEGQFAISSIDPAFHTWSSTSRTSHLDHVSIASRCASVGRAACLCQHKRTGFGNTVLSGNACRGVIIPGQASARLASPTYTSSHNYVIHSNIRR
jgi:hypothetical protein